MPGGAGSPLAGGAVAGCEADPRRVKGGRFPYGRAELVKELPALLVSLFRRGDVPGEAGGGKNPRRSGGGGGTKKWFHSAALVSENTACNSHSMC